MSKEKTLIELNKRYDSLTSEQKSKVDRLNQEYGYQRKGSQSHNQSAQTQQNFQRASYNQQEPENYVSGLESGLRGAAQGATFNFSDEVMGGLRGAYDWAKGEGSLSDMYDKNVAEERQLNVDAKNANPNAYLAGEIGGGVATAFVPGAGAGSVGRAIFNGVGNSALKRGLTSGAAQGAISGVGAADGNGVVESALSQAAGGAVLGAGLAGAGQLAKGVADRAGLTSARIDDLNSRGALQDTDPTMQGGPINESADQAQQRLTSEQDVSFDDMESAIRSGNSNRVADNASYDEDVAAAFDRQGVDSTAPYVTQDRNLQQYVGGRMSDASAPFSNQHQEIMQQTAQRADELVNDMAGTTDMIRFGSEFRDNFEDVHQGIKTQESDLYRQIDDNLPQGQAVPQNGLQEMQNIVSEFPRGADGLQGSLKGVLADLNVEGGLNYAQLNNLRQRVGQSLGSVMGEFSSVDQRTLSRLYDSITRDQEAMIANSGNPQLQQVWSQAKELTKKRKGLEDSMTQMFGRDHQKSITSTLNKAINKIVRGNDMRYFDRALNNIPEDYRGQAVGYAVARFMEEGSRMGRGYSVSGFAKNFESLRRKPDALQKLKSHMSDDQWKRFEDLGTISLAVRNVDKHRNFSNTANAIQSNIMQMATRIYSMTNGVPLLGDVLGAASNAVNKHAVSRSDNLLSDPAFVDTMRAAASGRADNIARAEQRLRRSRTYLGWLNEQSRENIEKISRAGLIKTLLPENSQDQRQQQDSEPAKYSL